MQQCIDQFIQRLYDARESQSRPLIPSSLRLLRSDIKARALSEETSHGENVVYTTTFVSLAPAVARTPRYSLSLSTDGSQLRFCAGIVRCTHREYASHPFERWLPQ